MTSAVKSGRVVSFLAKACKSDRPQSDNLPESCPLLDSTVLADETCGSVITNGGAILP